MLDGKKELWTSMRPCVRQLKNWPRRSGEPEALRGGPSEDGDGLKMIFLSGGGAKLAGLRILLEERMGVPVRLSEPFRGFNVSKNIDRDYLLDAAPYFAVGAGLSIRRPGDK